MSVTSRTSFSRAALVVALLPLGACSIFAIKPLEPKATPGGAPAATPATKPAAGQPAAQPTRPPAGAAATTPPAGTPPATTPPAGTPPAGTPPATTPPATKPAAATPAPRPAAPALTPAQVEAQRAVRDSTRLAEALTKRRHSRVYLTLNYDLHGARLRTATGGVDGGEEEIGMGSLEFSMQKSTGRGLGLAFRTIGGGTDGPEYVEAAVLMGSRRLAFDLGAATRTGYDALGLAGGGAYDTMYIFPRAGFRSRANLGNTDFSVTLRGLYYIGLPPLDDNLPDGKLEGWSGETGLSWTWKRFPLTVNMGYRIERFQVFDREQETSSFVLGGGLLLGRRPRPPAVAAPAPAAAPAATPTTPPVRKP